MSSYGPGSMAGSGIDAIELELNVECPKCGYESELSFVTDDYHRVDEPVECLKCRHTFRFTNDGV